MRTREQSVLHPRERDQFVPHTVVTPSRTRDSVTTNLGQGIDDSLEFGFQIGQLLLDDVVIELVVGLTNLSTDDEECRMSVRAAKLGVGVLHEETEHANGLVVIGELVVNSTEDSLASLPGQGVVDVKHMGGSEANSRTGSLLLTSEGWNRFGVPLAFA